MMAEALAGPLMRAVGEAAAELSGASMPSRRHDARLEGVPPPMIPNNTESPTTVCAMQASTRCHALLCCLHVRGWAALHCGQLCRRDTAVGREGGPLTDPLPP
jgi:hypothetical protein